MRACQDGYDVLADADTLVRQNIDIPRREARRWLHVPIDQEELIADGSEGLAKAAQRFDPRRGVPFAAYAILYVRGAIMDTIRARARRHADRNGSYVDVVSLDEPTLDGRSLRHEVADPRAQTAEIAEDLEQIRLVAGLPKKERYVLLRTQVDGATAEEVGRELGVSADRVYALAANGATRLRRRAA